MIKIVSIIIIIILYNCNPPNPKCPKVNNGVIDLTEWDFSKNGICDLKGEWEFYWNKFYNLKEIEEISKTTLKYIKVPSSWNDFTTENNSIGGIGYATYRLKIKLSQSQKDLGLMNIYIGTAYNLFINSDLIHSIGNPDSDPEKFIPKNGLMLIPLKEKDEYNLVIHVSNYLHYKAGIRRNIQIGLYSDLQSNRIKITSLDLVIAGSLLIMGLYHIFIYSLRNSIKAHLYFGIFCLLFFCRVLFAGESYITVIFPDLPYEFNTRMEYVSIYFSLPIFGLYIYHSYKKYISKKILIVFLICNIPFVYYNLFADIYTLTKSLIYYEILLIIFIVSIIILLIRLIIIKERDVLYTLISGIIFSICIVNDVLTNVNVINSIYIASYGFFIVIFSQSILISIRYTNALRESEEARDYLEKNERDLIKSKNEIEKLSLSKDIFISNLSHEIKTPLSYIYAYSEFLQTNGLNSSTVNYISEIYSNAKKLNDYINDLILLTEIDTNISIKLENVILKQLISDVFMYFEDRTKEKNINIVIDLEESIIINVDTKLFSKSIAHILKNAIMYNKQNGKIQISYNKDNQKNNLIFSDSGIGLKPHELTKIFEKFYRGDSSSYEYEGVGLGLYIADRIINLHGGKILAYIQNPEGSVFKIIW